MLYPLSYEGLTCTFVLDTGRVSVCWVRACHLAPDGLCRVPSLDHCTRHARYSTRALRCRVYGWRCRVIPLGCGSVKRSCARFSGRS